MVQKFDFQEMDLKGAYIIKPFYATDDRGCLIKDYNLDTFKAAGIDYELKETFYTISKRGVIRSTHFQLEKPQRRVGRQHLRAHVGQGDIRPGRFSLLGGDLLFGFHVFFLLFVLFIYAASSALTRARSF